MLLGRIPDPRDRAEVAEDLDTLHRRLRARVGRPRATLWYARELLRYAWFGPRTARAARAARATRARRRRAERPGMGSLVDSLGQDLRFTTRGFLRAPGLVLVAVPTIALALGASTAVFSVADALLLRPLAVPEPGRLLELWHVSSEPPPAWSEFSYPDYLDLVERGTTLESVAAFAPVEVRVGEGLDSEPVEGMIVSGNYFDVLGVEPLLGRGFLAEEDRDPGTHPVVVIGEDLWRRRFAGEPAALGRELVLNGRPFRVVGVARRRTPSPDPGVSPDLWVPLMMHRTLLPDFNVFGIELFGNRGTHWLRILGRLRAGATIESAGAELVSIARAQAEENPETNAGWSIRAGRAGDPRQGQPSQRTLARLTGLLAGVVAIVLLIACANVANLLLARATARRTEMGVRAALGAGRGRLGRQVLTEALVLALVGGAAGVLLALGLLELLGSLGLGRSLPGLDARLDGRVLAFGFAATLVTGLLFGVLPALQASAVQVVHGGRGGALSEPGWGRLPLRELLVVVQVALSLVLLVGGGLMLRTLRNLATVPLGFDAEAVRVAQLEPPPAPGPAGATDPAELQRRVVERVRDLPGVSAASLALVSPFSELRMANDVFWESGDSAGSLARTNVDMNVVGVDYFTTMGIPLLLGRPFGPDDVSGGGGGRDVAVVNQALAERLWPGESPLGKRLWSWMPEGPDQELEVVGVAANGRYYRSWQSGDQPFVFLALAQNPQRSVALHLRSRDRRSPGDEAVRRAVAEVAPGVPAPAVRTARETQASTIVMQRSVARLLGLFGALAASIAALGIYGVVSFMVTRRTHEIGVRVALGARPRDVRRLVVARSSLPVLAGLALGTAAALALGRFVRGLLFEVGPRDPVTFLLVAGALGAVGVLASWVPARRATRVSPLEALRE